MSTTAREPLDQCPACGAQWSEQGEDGRTYHPLLGGNIVNDRVDSWWCLACKQSWRRGDMSIYKPTDG